MRSIAISLAGISAAISVPALAHTTETPHSHPHLVDMSFYEAAILSGLLATAVIVVRSARHAVARRRK